MKNKTVFFSSILGLGILLSACSNRYEKVEYMTKTAQETQPMLVIGETSGADAIHIEQEMPEDISNRNQDELSDAEMTASQGEHIGGSAIHLLFGGDVLLSNHVLNAYNKAGGIAGVLDEGYRSEIADADFFMANEEFPFSDRGTQAADKQYTFRLPPDSIHILNEMGLDAVGLANNHALDFGQDALADTWTALDGAGILHAGSGSNVNDASRPVLTEINGKKITVFAATRVIPEASWTAGSSHAGMFATYDPTALCNAVKAARQEQDYIVVFVHWGIERDEIPQDYQRTMAKQYIDAGADLVVGAHPHVLQGIEYYKGKPIFYSLGNFVFGSSIPRTALLEVTLPSEGAEDAAGEAGTQASSVPAYRLIPGTSGAGYTHLLTEASQKQEFAAYMTGISFGVTVQEDGTVREAE